MIESLPDVPGLCGLPCQRKHQQGSSWCWLKPRRSRKHENIYPSGLGCPLPSRSCWGSAGSMDLREALLKGLLSSACQAQFPRQKTAQPPLERGEKGARMSGLWRAFLRGWSCVPPRSTAPHLWPCAFRSQPDQLHIHLVCWPMERSLEMAKGRPSGWQSPC